MKAKILVVGRNIEIQQVILRLINSQSVYEAMGVLTDEGAIEAFTKNDFDLVLIGGGVDEYSEAMLSDQFRSKKKGIKIIRHYGGGSGLLFNELQAALGNQS
jgi:DNA-binding NtrC family response regulator